MEQEEKITLINVKITEKQKQQFKDFCSSIGLTTSAAISLYIKKVIQTQKIPFEISHNQIAELNKEATVTKDDLTQLLRSQSTIINEQMKKLQELVKIRNDKEKENTK